MSQTEAPAPAPVPGSAKTKLTHTDYTVGWICALPKEQAIAIEMLDDIHETLPTPPTDLNAPTLGSIHGHNVVIVCLPKGQYGTNRAATVATSLVSTFPAIKFGLMVGIGGGIPGKVRLGDVVVSTPSGPYPGVVQWDMGKAESTGFRRTGALNNPPGALLSALSKLESRHLMEGSNVREILDAVERKGKKNAVLFTRCEGLRDPLDNRPPSMLQSIWAMVVAILAFFLGWQTGASQPEAKPTEHIPKIYYGLIASGNQVIKDAKVRDEMCASLDGEVLCVEMEAAGLMNNFPCLVVRGICDYADSGKNKQWQEYAAGVAAAFAKEFLGEVQPHELAKERPVKEILNQIAASVFTTESNVRQVKSLLDDHRAAQILNWLTPADYGPEQSDLLRKREPGTGQWLLESDEYNRWLEGDFSTFFCPGIPGAGKTFLTATLVEDLYQRYSSDSSVGLVYIYCNYHRHQEQTLYELLLSVLKQLAQRRHRIPAEVEEMYMEWEQQRTHPKLEDIAQAINATVACYTRTFIAVDALDECQTLNNCRSRFLTELFAYQLKSEGKVRLFATSRYLADITERFAGMSSLEIRASPHDVTKYLRANMSKLPPFVYDDNDLQERITTSILEAIDGMFLLARLYIDSLEDRMTPKSLDKALHQLRFCGRSDKKDRHQLLLSDAYDQAMERISMQREGFRELATSVLSWVAYAKRPLRISELQDALAVEEGILVLDPRNRPEVRSMVSVCAGLIAVDEESEVIRLVHYTTQEYLLARGGTWLPKAKIEIARTCINYIKLAIFQNKHLPNIPWGEEAQTSADSYMLPVPNPELNESYLIDVDTRKGFVCSCCDQASSAAGSGKLEESTSIQFDDDTEEAGLGGSEIKWEADTEEINQQIEEKMEQTPEEIMEETVIRENKNEEANGVGWQPYLPWDDELEDVPYPGALFDLFPRCFERGRFYRWIEDSLYKYAIENWGDYTRESSADGSDYVLGFLEDQTAMWEVGKYLLTPLIGPPQCIGLHLAAHFGLSKSMRILLERSADLEAKRNEGWKPKAESKNDRVEWTLRWVRSQYEDEWTSMESVGWTPLLRAANNGHNDVVRLLVQHGADIEAKTPQDDTPLTLAAARGHVDIVDFLIAKSADIEARNEYQRTALLATVYGYIAAAGESGRTSTTLQGPGYIQVIQLLLNHNANIEATDHAGCTALAVSILHGLRLLPRLLLSRGANPNAESRGYKPILHTAVEENSADIAYHLVKTGANIETRDYKGRTAIFSLMRTDVWSTKDWLYRDGPRVLKFLLNRGADIHATDNSGQTALFYAASSRSLEFARLLIERGSTLEARDKTGATAIFEIRSSRSWLHAASSEPKCARAMVLLFHAKGANMNAVDHLKENALFRATRYRDYPVISALACADIDIHARNAAGQTALFALFDLPVMVTTIRFPRVSERNVAKILLNHGMSLEARDNNGQTVLLRAVTRRNRDMVQLFVELGSDIEAKDNEGNTPLTLAVEKGDSKIVEILKSSHRLTKHVAEDGSMVTR
ncbi:ankyrin repeat-containing domain protein [Aspergillus karnatakaensis]|uniref:ankyrin repeat-containing domain protein n=1 Tax=Aspergillus karnatakaensis TaxID=1810916 RepID=UPI003CCD5076